MNTVIFGLVEHLDFHYPKLGRVVFQQNALGATILEQLRAWDCQNALIVVPRSLKNAEPICALIDEVSAAGLGVGFFCRAMKHTPIGVATELATQISVNGVDAVIVIGGSSATDTTKAAILMASLGHTGEMASITTLTEACIESAGRQLECRLISVPTTLSGGEFTPVVGISDATTGHKAILRHEGVCSDMVLLDPALVLETPDRLWASTGMKLIDHAVERLLAQNHNLLIDAQCRHGLKSVMKLLEPSIGRGEARTAARSALLQVLWLIQSSHGNVGTGLSHALSHQIGCICGLDHGIGSAIFLPATLRLLSRSGRVRADRANILIEALGAPASAEPLEEAAALLELLRERLGLPSSLTEAGIRTLDIDHAVAAVLADPTVRTSPGESFTPEEISELLNSVRD